jgi:hypothetical protein
MASKEGSSYQNSLRFLSGSGMVLYEKGKKAFENQNAGTYVSDAKSDVYVCTTAKTPKGEPIWGRLNTETMKPVGRFILINTGKSGKDASTRTLGGKEVEYTLPAVLKRAKLGQAYSTKAFGSFIFVMLSAIEVEQISSPPEGTTTSTVNATLGPSEYDLPNAILTAPKANNEMYNFMRTDSNGRSGFGATRTIKVLVGRDGLGYPIYEERPFINRTDENGRSGFGATATSPAPSGATNPSSPSASSSGKTGGGKGSSASPEAPGKSPTRPIIEVSFLPDRNIYNGVETYNEYQDKPHIQQIITEFDSVKKTRQRIIRRHIFEIVPNSFEFSQLSSTWNEVERSGNYPMVDWSKYNLTKCSFRFLVASTRTDSINGAETTVNDGMDVDVEKQLDNIRAIAGAPYPIVFNNLNKLLSTSYRFPYLDNTKTIQWVIADLSINATRLTPGGRKIAAAEVSITLNEYPVIARDIVPLPPLAPDNPVTKQCKPTAKNNYCKPKTIKDTLYTDDYVFRPDDSLETPEKKA